MAKIDKRRLSAPGYITETPLRGVTKTHLKKHLKKRQSCGAVFKTFGQNTSIGSMDKTLNSSKQYLSDKSFSPYSLAQKLQEFGKEYLKKGDIEDIPDAKGITVKDLSFSINEFENKKKECLSKCRNADALESSHAINLDLSDAALAGAKCLLTETIATRSVTKRICQETGATEEQILFDHNDCVPEHKWTAEVDRKIKDNIFETLCDLKSQISLKSSILENIQTPDDVKKRLRLRSINQDNSADEMKTPVNNGRVDPLSYTKIQEHYAARVASDLRQRRVVKKNPIPHFNS
uniref:PPP1R35_C domain-containing protein n=1 Tax=Strongyloides papillosus TaxID=174720 RepID=A0A0N5B6P4_STREA